MRQASHPTNQIKTAIKIIAMEKIIGTFLDAQTIACKVRKPDSVSTWNSYDFTEPHETIERIAESHVLCTNKVKLQAAELEAAANLKLIVVAATGYDIIDMQACKAKGVVVCNSPGYSASSVPEHALALMFAVARFLVPLSRKACDGTWSASRIFCLHAHTAIELAGRRVGIIGAGSLGRATAKLCSAVGMEVVYLARENSKADGLPRVRLDELLATCDVISLHCPLSSDNHHLLNAQTLAQVKPGAIVINTARGALIDPQALVDALESGRLAGAGIDVLELEPPKSGNPLLDCEHPGLIVTPHVGWASLASQQRLVDMLCSTCDSFFAGAPEHVVS